VNREQAKEVLLLYRAGQDPDSDPEMAQAMTLAARDPELRDWFEEHQRFQQTVRSELRQIRPPAGGKEVLLAEQKVVRVPFHLNSAWLAAAAGMVLLLCLVRFWPTSRPPDHFADFQAMMVSKATLQYGMDFRTHDNLELRHLISTTGAPADYALTRGLEKLPLTGGGSLRWRSNPVAMVCFDCGASNMVFLFVMKTDAVKDPPSEKPELKRVSSLMTANWTSGDKTYVLAGPDDDNFMQRYF